MKIIKEIKEMQSVASKLRREGTLVGFVPTMGALHAGHLSLIKAARHDNSVVVVSIFVNPAQFGRGEDYRRYPRTFAQDVFLCRKEGVDFIFSPSAGSMYPNDYQTHVEVEALSKPLCGRFRPGHFRGVATVVLKLFHIVQPTIAYFGWKDAQQALLIRRMIKDLHVPVKVKIGHIVREKDRLAMSSRNAYLTEGQRKEACVIPEALRLARTLIMSGEKNSSAIIRQMKRLIKKARSAKVQYISIVDLGHLTKQARIKGKVLIALAVWFGKTRLIDNTIMSV